VESFISLFLVLLSLAFSVSVEQKAIFYQVGRRIAFRTPRANNYWLGLSPAEAKSLQQNYAFVRFQQVEADSMKPM
jgi:hypothetical protein